MANEIDPVVLSAPHDNSGGEQPHNVIKTFVEKWGSEEYKQYASLAEGARKLFYQKFCEKRPGRFSVAALKCIIQARAKSSETIQDSINRREKDRKVPFATAEKIKEAMPDLAGIRVILVFPDDEDKITDFIDKNTDQVQPPNYWGVDKDGSLKVDRFEHETKRRDRFVGYRATHYRVKLREEISDESNLAKGPGSLKTWWRGQWMQHLHDSWAEKAVEIQVTSMTMYAWQEVHHDLIYKTYEGKLTEDEVSTLDMVNGLVHANETALNQFHRSLTKRLESIRTQFRDVKHLEHWIATYLQKQFPASFKDKTPDMQYVVQLFNVLQLYELNTPEKLINAVEEVTERATRDADSADKEIELKSLQPALELIEDWRVDLESRLSLGWLEAGTDPSAWVLLKICENKSPFKNITSYGKTGRDFIVIAAITLEFALDARSKPCDTTSMHEAYAFGVSAKSSISQILQWTGQKGRFDSWGNGYARICGKEGTFESLLHYIQDLFRSWKYGHPNYTKFQPSTALLPAVCLALALLKISAIPYAEKYPWDEQLPVFWPGTVNLKAMAVNLRMSAEDMRHEINGHRLYLRHVQWHSFLVMVDDKWVHLPLSRNHWKTHNRAWTFVKTEIPVAMNSLDLAILSETYSDEWLEAPGLQARTTWELEDVSDEC